jgi:hypothetical protein
MTDEDAADREHQMLVELLVEKIELLLGYQPPTVRSAVLAILLARLLTDYPSRHMRSEILELHYVLIDGIVGHFDQQHARRQAN